MQDYSIREYGPGDPSLVSHLQMRLYWKRYGFKAIFEYYLTRGMAEFLKDPSGGQLWVAEKGGAIVGSIAVVKLREDSAQLRWFAVDDRAQGMGIGSALFDVAMKFCGDRGYAHIELWTADILHAARHLYQKRGFVPTETKENTEWTDHVLLEEKWEYHGG
ncbi:MAG: GNAT family N-acetyltransferase [Clostridiales bacterium]|nr:GNAT family N-acetyltransferase [Clostridiales bacterium]